MQRFVPLLAVAILGLALALLYGPQLYRQWTFERDVGAMLAAARSGDTAGMVRAIAPAQQREAQRIFDSYLPADYAQRIVRLSLTRSEDSPAGGRYAFVVCRLESGGEPALYQGKLLWRWDGRRWAWDFTGSYAAPFSPSGEPQWYKLSDIIAEAGAD
jgi:hypothetical protein